MTHFAVADHSSTATPRGLRSCLGFGKGCQRFEKKAKPSPGMALKPRAVGDVVMWWCRDDVMVSNANDGMCVVGCWNETVPRGTHFWRLTFTEPKNQEKAHPPDYILQ